MAYPALEEADREHVLSHTADLWSELIGSRLFITGGTGFFGAWLLESWVWANECHGLGAEAVVLSRDPEAFRTRCPRLAAHPSIRLHQGDARTFPFPDGEFSHVIHAATPAHTATSEHACLEAIEGTRRALAFAAAKGARKFLLTSSGAVYGRQPPELSHLPEDDRGGPDLMDPRSGYGEGKRVSELLCALELRRSGLEAKIARCFAFIGPYLPLDGPFAIGNFLRDALSGGPVRVASDGTAYRSFLYAADLIIWLWTILLRAAPGRPYNVGSEEALTLAALARTIAARFGVECSIMREPVPGAPAERYIPATGRAARELGLRSWISLDEAIERTARWQRDGGGESS